MEIVDEENNNFLGRKNGGFFVSKKTGMTSARERSRDKRIKKGIFIRPKCNDCRLPIQRVYIVVQRHYKWLRDIYFCRKCQKLIHKEDAIFPKKETKK